MEQYNLKFRYEEKNYMIGSLDLLDLKYRMDSKFGQLKVELIRFKMLKRSSVLTELAFSSVLLSRN